MNSERAASNLTCNRSLPLFTCQNGTFSYLWPSYQSLTPFYIISKPLVNNSFRCAHISTQVFIFWNAGADLSSFTYPTAHIRCFSNPVQWLKHQRRCGPSKEAHIATMGEGNIQHTHPQVVSLDDANSPHHIKAILQRNLSSRCFNVLWAGEEASQKLQRL